MATDFAENPWSVSKRSWRKDHKKCLVFYFYRHRNPIVCKALGSIIYNILEYWFTLIVYVCIKTSYQITIRNLWTQGSIISLVLEYLMSWQTWWRVRVFQGNNSLQLSWYSKSPLCQNIFKKKSNCVKSWVP